MNAALPRLQQKVLFAIGGVLALFAGVSSVTTSVATRQLTVDYDAFVIEAAAWDRGERTNSLPGATAECDTWSALMAAGATEPNEGPNPYPLIAKLGTTPTPAQEETIAAASDRIARLRSTLRCKRRTREVANGEVDFAKSIGDFQGAYRQELALAYRGVDRLALVGTNDPSWLTPAAHFEAAQELVDSLEIGLLMASDGLRMPRRSGEGLVSAIAPYLTSHLGELSPSALHEIVASEYPTLQGDLVAARLWEPGRGNVMRSSRDGICAHSWALGCASEARGALQSSELMAAIAASSDHPFDVNECTNEANAIAGSGAQRSGLSFLCGPLAASALARESFAALTAAARARLESSVPETAEHLSSLESPRR